MADDAGVDGIGAGDDGTAVVFSRWRGSSSPSATENSSGVALGLVALAKRAERRRAIPTMFIRDTDFLDKADDEK
jgi:hypothetical protein